jgi:hypothetical protein
LVDLLVQQLDEGNAVLTKALVIGGETINTKSPIEISENINEITRQIIERKDFEKENIVPEEEKTVLEPEVVEDAPIDNTPVVWNRVNENFLSFRDKDLNLGKEEAAWMRSIVEKRVKRNAMLKEIDEVLDKENEELEKFKKEKLGI